MNYPDDYTADQGLKVIKFERDTYKSSSKGGYDRPTGSVLEYNFVRSFPLSIASIPVSYEASSLLKCTVSMSYIRYVVTMKKASESLPASTNPTKVSDLKNKSLSQNFLKNGAFNLPSSNVA